jgi:serine/threonine protein kinase/tetratricopeptide (TPR) repeat protein
MDGARWERIQSIFHQVSDAAPTEQRDLLRSLCGDDDDLMAELVAMLEEDARPLALLEGDMPRAMQDLLQGQPASPAVFDFGPYRRVRLLGEGGTGAVYLAERADIGGFVAIKLLRDGLLSPARRRRFAREQRMLGRLVHPLIAQIHDADTLDDGTPWFAMEFVEGKPLTDYCRDRGCSIAERLRLFRSVCEAVQYAHRQAIIHRDLKPSNILVTADGQVKLLDFGIAKQLQEAEEAADHTATAHRPMTVYYASPEQIRGDLLGTQTDVYSLGVILYELLAGQLPFDFSNRSQAEAERIILEREPELVSAVAKRIAKRTPSGKPVLHASREEWSELDILTATAMHKDLQRRYRSAEALIRDIDHFLSGEPLDARPDSLSYRLSKFLRRNKRALTATAAVCLLIIALVVFFVVRLTTARNAALTEAIRTKRIERFMMNLFDGGDKEAGPSGGLQVASLIDRGVKSAQTLNTDPIVQAELYQTLGTMYEKLGKLDQAGTLLQSSMDLRTSVRGADSREVADSLVQLGLLRLDQGKLPDAERLVRQALAIDQRHLRRDDPAMARDASALGRILEERGSYNEAITTLNDTLQVQKAKGELTTDLSDSTQELAIVHYYLGHLSIANSLYTEDLDMDRKLYGDVHPRIADDYYSLGTVQHDLGHDHEAEQFYRRALEIKKSWYGTEHPETAIMMDAVGQSLVYQQKYDEAAPILKEALASQEKILGRVHPQVAMGLNTLGLLELRRGHLSDAEQDFTRMADINRTVYGDRHFLVGIAFLNLGEVYLAEKDNVRAERSYREAFSRFTETLPPGHSTTAIGQVRLGHVLTLERRYKEAEGQLLAGYAVLIKQPGPQANRIENARKDLVTVYEALQQPADARKFQGNLSAVEQPAVSHPSRP